MSIKAAGGLDPSPATLPAWAAAQAARRPHAPALRHKQRGVWHVQTWAEVAAAIAKLAPSLAARGMGVGDTLVLLTQPRPEALLLSLAAQSLGASALPLDPLLSRDELAALLAPLQAAFIFAEGEPQVALALAIQPSPTLLTYADARGMAAHEHAALIPYAALLDTTAGQLPATSSAQHAALRFYRLDAGGKLQWQQFSHRELLAEGALLIENKGLSQREEALAARSFAAGSHARYLLASWLIAGYVLNFPENLATRDHDRRELGPTLVLGTTDSYTRLVRMARERLPAPGSRLRRLLDAALSPKAGPATRLLGYWLVRRPLREVLGLGRTRHALLVGEPLAADSAALYEALGVEIQAWGDSAGWQSQRARSHMAGGLAPVPRQA